MDLLLLYVVCFVRLGVHLWVVCVFRRCGVLCYL